VDLFLKFIQLKQNVCDFLTVLSDICPRFRQLTDSHGGGSLCCLNTGL
jgi:hypothetical protein